ncbi:hypothetical protein, partial [Neisseria sicca]|uniref:hypothetical protein n=1 Tax=Neisseria sicca TaxID=490 RepID=UPI001C98F76F
MEEDILMLDGEVFEDFDEGVVHDGGGGDIELGVLGWLVVFEVVLVKEVVDEGCVGVGVVLGEGAGEG